ncbi:UvrD-like helicase C-terminal domain-containing protein [Suillus ampliporus]|nr:UvrD-like helicase C-terminal domain-containing protein [Suillus ampliporus]
MARDWHSGRSGQWLSHPSSYSDNDPPSHLVPPPQLPQWSMVPVGGLSHPVGNSRYPDFGFQLEGRESQPAPQASDARELRTHNTDAFIYHALRLQEPVASGSQHQPLVSGISALSVGASNYHISQLQEPAGGTQHQPVAESQVNSSYRYHNLQHEASDVGTAFNAAAHPNYQTMHSQDPTDVSYTILQVEPQAPTVSAYQQSMSQGFHTSSIPQNAPQFPTALSLTTFDPSTSQVTPTQSSWLALGAHSPKVNRRFRSKKLIEKLVERRLQIRVLSHPSRDPNSINDIPSASTLSTRRTSHLQLESALIDCVKVDSTSLMNTSLFQFSLYPAIDDIDVLANKALDDAIAKHEHNVNELMSWKSRIEGQHLLSRLKGIVRKVHKDSMGCARGLVVGTYSLFLEVLFKDAGEIASSRQRDASALLLDDDYLDAIVRRLMNDGQVQSVCVPFGNPVIIGIVEYILVDQGYRQFISLKEPDWEVRLMNTFALSRAICNWVFEASLPEIVVEVSHPNLQSFTIAIYEVGGLFGALPNLWMGDKLGCRRTIAVGGSIMIIGAIPLRYGNGLIVSGVSTRVQSPAKTKFVDIDCANVSFPFRKEVELRFNAISRTIENTLQKEGIPNRILCGHQFFQRAEIKDILAYLQLMDNPQFEPAFSHTINIPSQGIGDKSLGEILSRAQKLSISPLTLVERIHDSIIPDLKPSVKRKVQSFMNVIRSLRSSATDRMEPAQLIGELVELIGYQEHLKKSQPDWDTQWENVQELINFASDATADASNIPVVSGDESSLQDTPLRQFLQASMLSSAGDQSDENDDKKVSIATCHTVKGLEWPVVFVPAVEEGTFPFYRNLTARQIHLSHTNSDGNLENQPAPPPPITRDIHLGYVPAFQSVRAGLRKDGTQTAVKVPLPAPQVEPPRLTPADLMDYFVDQSASFSAFRPRAKVESLVQLAVKPRSDRPQLVATMSMEVTKAAMVETKRMGRVMARPVVKSFK